MHRIQENSIKRKINEGTRTELHEIAKNMIDEWDKWPLMLFFNLKHRILNGYMIEEDLHVKLIVLSKSLTLYQSRHFLSIQSHLQFLRAGIPDVGIELKLAATVADDLRQNNYGMLRNSLETLRDYGSLACLDILEVVDYDIFGRVQVDKISCALFGKVSTRDSLTDFDVFAKKMTTSVNVRLANLLKQAIEQIKNRNATPESMSCAWSTL